MGLVLAGGSASVARGEGVSGRAAPSEAELIEVLRGALALVHPSRDEGFGLTPLEAMALGVPVLAVRNPGTEEVCGDAALLVGPGELVDGLVRRDLRRGAARGPRRRGRRAGGRLLVGRLGTSPRARLYPGSRLGGARAPHERRHPRHPRHPRLLQRLRDRRRADHQPAHRPRAPGHRLLPSARGRPRHPRVEGRRASCTCATVRNKYLDTFVHTAAVEHARRALGLATTWRCSSSRATARCAW